MINRIMSLPLAPLLLTIATTNGTLAVLLFATITHDPTRTIEIGFGGGAR